MQELIVNIAPNLASKLPDFYKALGDTMLMVLWSGLISFVFGLLLGVVLTVTKPNGILENKVVYQILDKLVSLFRSIPFIILLTWVMPITRALVGTVLYVRGAIVQARPGRIVFGATDERMGAVGGALSLFELPGVNHRPWVRRGVMAQEAKTLLADFFAARRGAKENEREGEGEVR